MAKKSALTIGIIAALGVSGHASASTLVSFDFSGWMTLLNPDGTFVGNRRESPAVVRISAVAQLNSRVNPRALEIRRAARLLTGWISGRSCGQSRKVLTVSPMRPYFEDEAFGNSGMSMPCATYIALIDGAVCGTYLYKAQ